VKKHCLLLGKTGLIYNSWLLILLFVAFIVAFEGNRAIVWPAIILGLIFAGLLFYSYFNSYVLQRGEQTKVKVPYKRQTTTVRAPKLIARWHSFAIYRVQLDELTSLTYLVLEKRRLAK
jgi:hypothetical protein